MPTLAYKDAYLSKFATTERETRAFADVDDQGAFATDWRNKLTVLRCYILACLENQAQADDLFASKLKHYRDEYKMTLGLARSSTEDEEGTPMTSMSISLERA